MITRRRAIRAFAAGMVAGAWGLVPAVGIAATAPFGRGRAADLEQRVGPRVGLRLALTRLEAGAPVVLRVFKAERVLELWLGDGGAGFRLFKRYPICTVSGTLGPKLRAGDGQAPEGYYEIRPNQLNPWSRYHLGLDLGYPNRFDRLWGRTGRHLLIHGGCSSEGCFAMTDRGIEEIYYLVERALDAGQPAVPVLALPFRMTEAALARHARSPWIAFWRNLAEGDRLFAVTSRPPEVTVDRTTRRYRFRGR